MASTIIGGPAVPALQRDWEVVEREPVAVRSPTPAVEEAAQDPSPATRFLLLLEEELQPESYTLPRDSQGYLVDPLRTIAVALRSEDPNASLLSPISQESVIRSPSLDPNDLGPEPVELTYPAPLASSVAAPGSSDRAEEPEIKYLCTVTRDGWTPLGERPVVVKREREEEEQVPEEVPRKKQRVQKRKALLRKSIRRANLGDPRPDEQISRVTLRPKQILRRPSRYTS